MTSVGQGDPPRTKDFLSLAEEVDGRSDGLAAGNIERQNFDLGVAERHPRLDLARPRPRGGTPRSGHCRGSLLLLRDAAGGGGGALRGVVHVEAERAALLDGAVGDEARVWFVGGVDGEDGQPLRGCRRRVATHDRVADGDRFTGTDERVEHICTPLDTVAHDQLRLRVDASSEPVQNADTVRQPRLTSHYDARLQAETHRTYTHSLHITVHGYDTIRYINCTEKLTGKLPV